MPRPTNSERLAKIHQESLVDFDGVQTAMRNERLQSLQDRRFYSIAGAMWEGPLSEQFENKPKMEVNKIHLAVIRIISEYRNNRITTQFLPKNGKPNDDLSDACNGLFRADMEDSCSEEAGDNAFEESVGGGIGAVRVTTEYEDEEDPESEEQRIRLEPIYDADSTVFWNLDAKRQDKSDATQCWVLVGKTRKSYKEEYDDDPASWPKMVHQSEFDWLTPDVVFIAEYYTIEFTRDEVITFEGLDGQVEKHRAKDVEEDEDLAHRLQATGFKEVSRKKMKRRRCHKYIMSGNKILKDCGFIAGKNIPIIPTYGKRWFVDNVERCMGHVRLPKDTQRLKNMQMSKLAEVSALSTVGKPIMDPKEMQGHTLMWSEDNIKNYPFLYKNQLLDTQGVPIIKPQEYTQPPQIAPATAALLQITDIDIKELLGNQEAGEQLDSHVSGVAVELVQQKLDMQTFIYISNLAKMWKRVGEVWLSMAQDVYVEEGRTMKTIDAQGETSSIELMRPIVNEDTGKTEYQNDLGEADMDVKVDVGPSSASKRLQIVRTLIGIYQVTDDAETKSVLGSMILMNLEGEGLQDMRDYFRQKLLKLGVLKPTDEEAQKLMKEAQAQPPDPNAEFLAAEAEKARAQALKVHSDVELNTAKVQQTHADTVKKFAEAEEIGHDSIRKSMDQLGAMFQEQTAPA